LGDVERLRKELASIKAGLKELYERSTGSRLARIVVVAPYAHPKAVEACLKMGVELYSRV